MSNWFLKKNIFDFQKLNPLNDHSVSMYKEGSIASMCEWVVKNKWKKA